MQKKFKTFWLVLEVHALKNPSRMRTEKKKSVYMYMYIFNVYVRKMMMKQIIVI